MPKNINIAFGHGRIATSHKVSLKATASKSNLCRLRLSVEEEVSGPVVTDAESWV